MNKETTMHEFGKLVVSIFRNSYHRERLREHNPSSLGHPTVQHGPQYVTEGDGKASGSLVGHNTVKIQT